MTVRSLIVLVMAGLCLAACGPAGDDAARESDPWRLGTAF